MDSTTDLELIIKIKDGDISPFSSLVNKYKDKVYSLCVKIVKDEMAAEDVVQMVFIKVFKNLDGFKMQSEFSTWLYRITYNTAVSHLKSINKYQNNESLDMAEMVESDAATGISELEFSDRQKYLALAQAKLSREEVILLDLFYKEEMDLKEISEVLSISHGNARVKLMRARNRLMVELQSLLKTESQEL